MVVGLSTSWAAGQVTSGRELVERCKAMNVDGLELDYRLPAPLFQQVVASLRGSGLQVLSVHNFCPVPAPVPWDRICAEPFLLSHLDREERLRAVQWTLRTMERADHVGARLVVVHCGRVVMDPELTALITSWEATGPDGKEFRTLMDRKLEERRARVAPFLHALLWSLDRLAREAERLNVTLGLENRAHYHEMPGPEEYPVIFKELEGAPLAYWHDTGHGHLMEIFGWGNPMEMLETWKQRLCGIHLHDADGPNDHLPPGSGRILFGPVVEVARDRGCPVIVEVKPGTGEQNLRDGIDFVRKLIMAPAEGMEDHHARGSNPRLHP